MGAVRFALHRQSSRNTQGKTRCLLVSHQAQDSGEENSVAPPLNRIVYQNTPINLQKVPGFPKWEILHTIPTVREYVPDICPETAPPSQLPSCGPAVANPHAGQATNTIRSISVEEPQQRKKERPLHRTTAFVSTSAIITFPGKWRRVTTSRETKSRRRNSAATVSSPSASVVSSVFFFAFGAGTLGGFLVEHTRGE